METKNRPNATAIKSLKERIKGLSSKQRILKLLRKTSLPEGSRKGLLVDTGMVETWKGLDPQAISYKAWTLVNARRLEITAALNLYHELRGSEHRHGVDETSEYYYDKMMAAIRKELAI